MNTSIMVGSMKEGRERERDREGSTYAKGNSQQFLGFFFRLIDEIYFYIKWWTKRVCKWRNTSTRETMTQNRRSWGGLGLSVVSWRREKNYSEIIRETFLLCKTVFIINGRTTQEPWRGGGWMLCLYGQRDAQRRIWSDSISTKHYDEQNNKVFDESAQNWVPGRRGSVEGESINMESTWD